MRNLISAFTGRQNEPIVQDCADLCAILPAGTRETKPISAGQAAEKGLATDGHGCTRIKNKGLIRVHPCESVAQIGFPHLAMTAPQNLQRRPSIPDLGLPA